MEGGSRALVASRSRAGDVAVALRGLHESQRELALANSRASSAALLLGFANRADNLRLAEAQRTLSLRLEQGEQVLGELSERVVEQASALGGVSAQVAGQDASIRQLEARVEEQRAALERLAAEHRHELEEQRRLISGQRAELGRLLLSKLRQDAALDAAVVALGWMLAASPLVSLPLRLALLPVQPVAGRRRAQALAGLARLLAAAAIARTMRLAAKRAGLHSSVGSPRVYFEQLAEYAAAGFSAAGVAAATSGFTTGAPPGAQQPKSRATVALAEPGELRTSGQDTAQATDPPLKGAPGATALAAREASDQSPGA
jgi:hypothetical protein